MLTEIEADFWVKSAYFLSFQDATIFPLCYDRYMSQNNEGESPMKKRTYLWTIGITLLVGALSSFLTRNDMSYYTELVNKPMLTPPAWIFPVVWTILYVLMGIGLGRVLESDGSQADKQAATRIYAVQLFFNFAWSIAFFTFRVYLFSFVWLLVLWALIIWMIFIFARSDRLAARLQIPYFLWVTFAAYLNLMIYLLNR